LYGNGSVVYDNDDLNGWFWKRLGMDWIEGFVVIECGSVIVSNFGLSDGFEWQKDCGSDYWGWEM
jgi:hypothetical protein